ncbi:TRAP-type C4-dicarboxylate transport system, small permease component [Pannonibacter phragmitetus]|uniref:TRAP transporter small permease protein n=1 Tax=Pannonibacter phragmitetus TaxID=121719 RepID=A0A378ZY11_9HYPH|nr:TRAP transporter small permease subunit [Pannonibacter phragmitetus]SUB02112.1 TRAP-type C4-dicarboxylate transport system, small permease component [Pannonibacter phragmitetus]
MKHIANILGRISDGLDRIMRGAAVLFLLVMVAAICLQVVARYGFSSPPAWTEEAARYAMVWVGLLGATVAFKAKFDPTLVPVPVHLPRALQLAAGAVRALSVFIFLAPVLWFCFFGPGMSTARSFLSRSLQTSAETFPLPSIFITISVPLFIAVIFVHGLARMANELTRPHRADNQA